VLHRLALAEKRSVASFPSLAAGEEVGAVCPAGEACEAAAFEGRFGGDAPAFESVTVETLDALLPGATVDFLLLDVEGYDPLVLAGGRETVARARFLEFEYHFRGAWAEDVTLERTAADLDAAGFDCYLQGAHSALWRLSRGCFHAAFELRAWSNVACVRRDEPAWAAILDERAVY